jgi:hypothetical protein
MTAGCITFDELESRANEARAVRWETRNVLERSEAYQRVDFYLLAEAAYQTFAIKFRLHLLALRQQSVLGRLVGANYAVRPKEDIKELVSLIDQLVRHERELLKDSHRLGMVTRFLWKGPLAKMREQTEHLDSISESLHITLDDKTTALMAMALEEVTK